MISSNNIFIVLVILIVILSVAKNLVYRTYYAYEILRFAQDDSGSFLCFARFEIRQFRITSFRIENTDDTDI